MEIIPELVTMIKGMISAIRAVQSAILILILLVYVFAIIMNAVIGEDEGIDPDYFGTVRGAMVTLIAQGVFLDNLTDLVHSIIRVKNIPAIMCFALFVLLSAVTVMNMLIGVLCQVVLDVSAGEKERHVKQQMTKTLLVMLQTLDADGSGELSKAEVQSVICDPEAVALMNDIQVDTQHLFDISEMLYESEDCSLPISVFMHIVLSLRGQRSPTMSDLAKEHNLRMWAMETQLAHHRELMSEAVVEILKPIVDTLRSTQKVAMGNGIHYHTQKHMENGTQCQTGQWEL